MRIFFSDSVDNHEKKLNKNKNVLMCLQYKLYTIL